MATLAPSAAASSAAASDTNTAANADGHLSAASGGNEAFRTQARVEVLRRMLIARLRDRLRDTVRFWGLLKISQYVTLFLVEIELSSQYIRSEARPRVDICMQCMYFCSCLTKAQSTCLEVRSSVDNVIFVLFVPVSHNYLFVDSMFFLDRLTLPTTMSPSSP